MHSTSPNCLERRRSVRTRSQSSSSDLLTRSHTNGWYEGTCTEPNKTRSAGVTTDAPYYSRTSSRTTQDVEIEGFYRRSRNGEIFCNPFISHTEETYNPLHSHASSFKHVGAMCANGNYPITGDYWTSTIAATSSLGGAINALALPAIDIPRLQEIAIAAAYSNIGVDSLNAWATAGESKETVSSLVGTFKKVLKISKAIRRFDLKTLKGEISPSAIKEKYMEFRYALRPLWYEADGILQAYTDSKYLVRKPMRQTFRGYASESASDTWNGYGYSDTRVRVLAAGSVTRHVEVRAGVLTHVAILSDLQYLGLDKPLTALWELVPLSFIVDWFCNVGKLIGAWEPKWGFTTLASWVTVKDTATYSYWVTGSEIFNSYWLPNSSASWSGPPYTKVTCTTTRSPWGTRPIIPRLNVNLDALKLLDLGIIVSQLMRTTTR